MIDVAYCSLVAFWLVQFHALSGDAVALFFTRNSLTVGDLVKRVGP
jgi:hypothetical protein